MSVATFLILCTFAKNMSSNNSIVGVLLKPTFSLLCQIPQLLSHEKTISFSVQIGNHMGEAL